MGTSKIVPKVGTILGGASIALEGMWRASDSYGLRKPASLICLPVLLRIHQLLGIFFRQHDLMRDRKKRGHLLGVYEEERHWILE
jgi:hypothetical protein